MRPAEVFRQAVRRNSAAIIVAHNHIGDDPIPSVGDAVTTRRLIAAGRILDITVLDHLIFSETRWVSLRTLALAIIGPDDRLWGQQDLVSGWDDDWLGQTKPAAEEGKVKSIEWIRRSRGRSRRWKKRFFSTPIGSRSLQLPPAGVFILCRIGATATSPAIFRAAAPALLQPG